MNYEKTLEEYYNKGFSEGIRFAGDRIRDGIGAGTAAILVWDERMKAWKF